MLNLVSEGIAMGENCSALRVDRGMARMYVQLVGLDLSKAPASVYLAERSAAIKIVPLITARCSDAEIRYGEQGTILQNLLIRRK